MTLQLDLLSHTVMEITLPNGSKRELPITVGALGVIVQLLQAHQKPRDTHWGKTGSEQSPTAAMIKAMLASGEATVRRLDASGKEVLTLDDLAF